MPLKSLQSYPNCHLPLTHSPGNLNHGIAAVSSSYLLLETGGDIKKPRAFVARRKVINLTQESVRRVRRPLALFRVGRFRWHPRDFTRCRRRRSRAAHMSHLDLCRRSRSLRDFSIVNSNCLLSRARDVCVGRARSKFECDICQRRGLPLPLI